MRWLLLVPILATGCLHGPDPALERQRSALKAAKNASWAAQARKERVRHDASREDAYREARKAALLASMRGAVAPRGRGAILAVFEVEDHDAILSDAERAELSAYFATAMLERTSSRIVPPDRIRRELLDAKTRSYRACFDDGCQVELGRRLAADHTLEPGLFRSDDGCQLGATLYDLATETTTWASSTTTSCDVMSLYLASETLARSLAEKQGRLR